MFFCCIAGSVSGFLHFHFPGGRGPVETHREEEINQSDIRSAAVVMQDESFVAQQSNVLPLCLKSSPAAAKGPPPPGLGVVQEAR